MKYNIKKILSVILIVVIMTFAAMPTALAAPSSHTGGRNTRQIGSLVEHRAWGQTVWSTRHTTTARFANRLTGSVIGAPATHTGTGTTIARTAWTSNSYVVTFGIGQAQSFWRTGG